MQKNTAAAITKMTKIATLMPIPAFAAVERPEEVTGILEDSGDAAGFDDASEMRLFAVWVVEDFAV